MSEGFLDFSMDEGDDKIGKKSSRFKPETGRSYRASFCWFSVKKADDTWDDEAAIKPDGTLHPEAQIRYTGCERIYKNGVGYFLYKGPAYAQFGQPKQTVATIIVVWPTDKEGELDVASYKAGKNWQVMSWPFSTDKYQTIKKSNKRFPLLAHDLTMTCTDAQYQKMTFTPENESLLQKYMSSDKPEYKSVSAKILAEVKGVAASIHRDLARDLTVDQIKEAAGESTDTPTGGGSNHAAQNVDSLLDDVL